MCPQPKHRPAHDRRTQCTDTEARHAICILGQIHRNPGRPQSRDRASEGLEPRTFVRIHGDHDVWATFKGSADRAGQKRARAMLNEHAHAVRVRLFNGFGEVDRF